MRGASRTIFLQKRFIMKKILLAATACLALASAPVKADTFLETSVGGVIGAQSVVIGSPIIWDVSAG